MALNLKQQLLEFYNKSGLDNLYYKFSFDQKKQYFHRLKLSASQDLSWAHCIQHDQAAKITQAVSGHAVPEPFTSQFSANSTHKKPDTCYIKNNCIHGEKYYVSSLPWADYAVIYVTDLDRGGMSNLLVPRSEFDCDLDSFRPIGMENTVTGTMKFHGQSLDNFDLLISKQDPKIFIRENFMDLAFPTNCIGLCFGLCADIESFILDNDLTDVDSEFKKLKLDLFSYEQVWKSMLDLMIDAEPNTDYYNYSFLLYNNGKKMLNSLCKFVLDNGTGYFYQLNSNSQRFRDAVIYTSHMHNYRTSTREFFRHRENFQ